MPYGLKQDVIGKIQGVFELFDEVQEVILYGSRAKGNAKPGSDIDLTMKGENLDLKLMNKVSNKLDDLLLPYTIDLSVFYLIDDQDLLDHIERVGKVFYKKSGRL